MRLIGAKEFLKTVKAGTLFIQYWENSKEECLKIIKDFNDGINIIENYYGTFHIFGDNGHSLTFIVDEEDIDSTTAKIDNVTYNCLFDYDCNIVGDSSPSTTLYLVFDNEEEYPNEIAVRSSYEDIEYEPLTKEDIKRIQKWYLETDYFCDESSTEQWALQSLYDDYYKDDEIVNYGLVNN